MEPEEFLDPNKTVYHWNQVLTQQDLADAITELWAEYTATPVIYMWEREKIATSIQTLSTFLDWLEKGKPSNYGQDGQHSREPYENL